MQKKSKNIPVKELHHNADEKKKSSPETERVEEIGGVKGPEPTRYGDWEKNGRCIDF